MLIKLIAHTLIKLRVTMKLIFSKKKLKNRRKSILNKSVKGIKLEQILQGDQKTLVLKLKAIRILLHQMVENY
ncbi:hypothetical protein ACVNPZ_03025 [Staphylococcus aureus]